MAWPLQASFVPSDSGSAACVDAGAALLELLPLSSPPPQPSANTPVARMSMHAPANRRIIRLSSFVWDRPWGADIMPSSVLPRHRGRKSSDSAFQEHARARSSYWLD